MKIYVEQQILISIPHQLHQLVIIKQKFAGLTNLLFQMILFYQKDILNQTQNFLISSAGKVIKIWKQINENQWEMFSCQKNHFHQITCMVFNQEEDQLISSSIDCTINIWQVNKELNVISYSQTLTNYNDYVYSVNLSPSGALLASCDKSGGIIVWELNNNKMWELKQLISTQKGDFGFHVKFINENKLIYQQYKVGIITQLNRIDNKFQISQQKIIFSDQSDSDCMFSIILLVKKKLLIFRHFSSIYIFKLENDQDHQKLIQKLNCTHSSIYGQISKNEKYLAYWDYGLKEILLYKIL